MKRYIIPQTEFQGVLTGVLCASPGTPMQPPGSASGDYNY